MAYLVGTDEAGYGPNLGPLVISATVWHVPEDVRAADLYRILADVVATAPSRAGDHLPLRIAIADSKTLYPSTKGLRHLESGVLAAMGVLNRHPTTWSAVWDLLAPGATACRQTIPWYANYDASVPCVLSHDELVSLKATLCSGLTANSIQLMEMRSHVIFEEEFNDLVDQYSSKGAVLSHATLNLVSEVCQPLENEPIFVVCDKHGGRNCYQDLLADHFADWLIEVYGESREQSVYRFGPHDRRMEVTFQMKAESLLPAALASMASKYLRELAMEALNAFWCSHVPGLQRTAGYPQDARRFKTAIAAVQSELRIDDRKLWRMR